MNFEQAEMVLSKSVSMQPRQRQPHRTRARWAKSQSGHGSRAESRLYRPCWTTDRTDAGAGQVQLAYRCIIGSHLK